MALSATRWGVQVLSKVRPPKAVTSDWNVGKYKNQLECIQADAGKVEKEIHKLNYIASDYCKVGLLNHDQLVEVDPIVKEARRRMTDEENQARYFRVSRAQVMSTNHRILPEDEWTPMDADHNYLEPHIQAVRNEMMERKLIKCAMLDFEDGWDRLFLIPFRMRYYVEIRNMRNKLRQELVAPQLL